MTEKLTLKVNDKGWLSYESESLLLNHLEKHAGQNVLVTIIPVADLRAAGQARLFYLYRDMIANYSGEEKKDVERVLKEEFEVDSIKTITKSEMADFLEFIQRWAAINLSLTLPANYDNRRTD